MFIKNFDPNGQMVRRLVMCSAPQTGSTLVYHSPLSTKTLRELAPTWSWYRTRIAKDFEVPGQWKNRTLDDLNSFPLPPSINYYLLYGVGIDTKTNLSAMVSGPTFGFTDGDGVVDAWSQLGYLVRNDVHGKAWQADRIPAFARLDPLEIQVSHGHYGFLDAAKDLIEASLESP